MAEASQNLIGRTLTLYVRPTPYRCVYAGKRKKNLSETFRLWLVGMIVVAALTVFLVFATVYGTPGPKHWTAWLPLVNVLALVWLGLSAYRAVLRRRDMLTDDSSRTHSPALQYRAAREVRVYSWLPIFMFGIPTSANSSSRSDADPWLLLIIANCLLTLVIFLIAGFAIAEGQAIYREQLARRAARLAAKTA